MSTASYEYQSCWPEDIMNVTNLRTSILNGSYEHLSKTECIEKYATNFVSDRRNVVLVTQSPMTGDGVSFSGYGYAGGIAAANPANTNPDDYDSWFTSVLPIETIDPLGYEWMCYMKGWSGSGTSCSSVLLEEESEWNVASRDWARQTTTLIPGTGQELSRQGLTIQSISEWETWLMEFKNISWTRAEVGTFLTEVQANPLPEQMLAYLKNTSWNTSGVNVSSHCPSSWNLDQYDLFDNELPQYPVDYCLSQKVGEECGVFYHLPIAIVVIICSIIKLGCMWFLLRMDRQDLIITLGDAISAFLQQPDQATKYWCTLSAKTVSKSDEFSGKKENDLPSHDESCSKEPHPDLLPLVTTKWTKASNVKIWCLTWLMLVLYIVMSLLLPEAAVENTSTHATQSLTPSTAIWQIKGWGDVQSTALLSKFASSFTGMVLLSNTPQLAVSILYFCLNDTMTRYLFAAGYSDHARNRRPLRVSYPRGEQQSTLYLTIPYQYAAPLLTAVTLVHWFISEGLFYVQILPYDLSGNPIFSARLITCGVSTIPLEMALFLMIIVCVVVCLLGCKSLKPSRMPLAFGCSLAISAACHPPSYDLDAAFKPVQWGAVEDEPGQLYSHCSFTSKEAKEPETGVQYA
ncbi:hypothetical protein N7488_000156 [Penicillium malachiteum]|nr:hypothetical protein N7488_000156 [Penicillium malachiteum]